MNILRLLENVAGRFAHAAPVFRPRFPERFGDLLLIGLIALAISTPAAPASPAVEATVTTLDGVEHTGEVAFAEGGFVLTPPGDERREFPLGEIRRLTFEPSTATLAAAGVLGQGWEWLDYGTDGTRGFSGQGRGSFLLKTLGAGGHFVYRRTSLPGEMVARVDRLEPGSIAGLRVQRGPHGDPGALYLAADGAVHFVVRGPGQHGVASTTEPGEAMLPCWLKLRRSEEVLEAFYSSDGQTWQQVGSFRRWWQRVRSEDDDDDDDDDDGRRQPILAGLFVESAGEPAGAEFSEVRIRGLGLLGEYFAGADFEKPLLTRSGEGLRPEWGEGAPIPELRGLDAFSIRWSGELVPKETGSHGEFSVGADRRAALWINDALVAADDWPGFEPRDVTLELEAGKPCAIRVDYSFQGDSRASHHLSILMKRPGHDEDEPIPFDMLRHEIRGELATGSPQPPPGLLLVDGSFLAGRLVKADTATITLASGEAAEQSVVPRQQVDRIHLAPVSSVVEFPGAGDRIGARMINGDFLEGEFTGAADGQLHIASLAFGPRSFTMAGNAVAEIVLRPEGGKTAPDLGEEGDMLFEVRTVTGSRWRLSDVPQVTPDGLSFHHDGLGRQQVAAGAVADITRLPKAAR